MDFTGIIVGLATFLIIGIFHPIVIKAEYYWGTKCWWLLLMAGIIFGALSLFVENLIISTILGVTALSSFWSILELIHQKKRVRKGCSLRAQDTRDKSVDERSRLLWGRLHFFQS